MLRGICFLFDVVFKPERVKALSYLSPQGNGANVEEMELKEGGMNNLILVT